VVDGSECAYCEYRVNESMPREREFTRAHRERNIRTRRGRNNIYKVLFIK